VRRVCSGDIEQALGFHVFHPAVRGGSVPRWDRRA
jgi:hypothetical protein